MLIEPSPDGLFYHEDLRPGASLTFGSRQVSRDEIIAFASAYDPQPMHLDEVAAKASIVGGLCASGFHTCAIMMRLLCDHFLLRSTSLGSPGLDAGNWLFPVRPGDTLAMRITVLESRALQSRPDVGVSKLLFELHRQNGDTVLEVTTNQLMRRRVAGAPSVAARAPKAAATVAASLWHEPVTAIGPGQGNFYEDIRLGDIQALGGHTFARDDIIAFAQQFDPQPFHLDEAAGQKSLFGGLAASGWHTASIFIRQLVRMRQAHEAQLQASGRPLAQWGPSPGFRNMAWLRPVLKDDHIEFRNKVIELRALKSRPTRGLLVSLGEGRNQRGEIVFSFTGQVFVERRGQV